LQSLQLDKFQTRKQIEDALAPRIPDLAVRRFLLKNLRQREPGRFEWKLNLENISNNYAQLNEPVGGEQPFARPTLFIRGEKSDYIQDNAVPLIRHLFPGAEIRSIAGADHWVHTDAPEAFCEAVLNFLAKAN
jgi:pimeloyl-ACP methyl ester carboxylesterase